MRNPLRYLFQRSETRSHAAGVSNVYIEAKRRAAHSEGSATLSATLATASGIWSRSFALLTPNPADVLTPAHLAAIGADLYWRGHSVWLIRLDGGKITLHRAAFWDMTSRGFNLTLPRPDGTDTVKALHDEVLSLAINASPETPWQGRSPLSFMGLSPSLLADIEATVSDTMPWVGRGILPIPSTIPEEQKSTMLPRFNGGSTLVAVSSKEDFAHHTGGSRSEWRRIDLGPDLAKAGLSETARDLHSRIMAASGIPPSLYDAGGNAGALRETYRLFVNQTLEPLARVITPELAKIGVQRLGTEDTLSSDTAGRARSVSSLVQSGVPLATAMSLVGWDNVSLPEGASKPIAAGGE